MRAALEHLRELLEGGDVRAAELALLDLIDSVGEAAATDPVRCKGCGRSFEWPGLLEAHRHACVALWSEGS